MDFSLTDDQLLIREAAENFLGDVSDSLAVRTAMETEAGFDAEVWRRIAGELGWCAMIVPEEFNGLGLGPVELVLVLEQMGRRLLCAPFFSTVCLAVNVLAAIGTEAARSRFLPSIAVGEMRATLPLHSDAGDWCATPFTAKRTASGWQIDGSGVQVPDAAGADGLFLFAAIEGETLPGLFAVPTAAAGVGIVAAKAWDMTRRFAKVDCCSVQVSDAERLDDPRRRAEGLVRSAALARLAIAAEQLGAAQQCLDLTVSYASERKQFGRAIAGFQAIKHRCAEMMVRIEATRSAVYGAAALASSGSEAAALALECAAARALAGDTLFWCAQEAIQLHGGVGFTWEFDPQLYFKRAQASSHWLGTSEALRERVAAAVIGTEASPCT